MREIVVVSGKGGTGKTSITAAFARLSEKTVVCDADVDAADLHLLLQPEVQQATDFMGGGIAVINREKCTECGKCQELCRFEAISDGFEVDAISCEGCGVCVDLCPENAVDFPQKKCGEWFSSLTKYGPMIHARLGIAEENSGKLVSLVRQKAKSVAEEQGFDLILTDGPPGIGCPVIAAIGGATVLVMVVEPTLSGIHDMDRLVDLAAHFRVPGMVVVNKYDLNLEMTKQIEESARQRNMQLLGRIPFDAIFVKAMVQGKSVLEFDPGAEVSKEIMRVWDSICQSSFMNPLGIKDFSKVIGA